MPDISEWPTRAPGQPYRWLLNLATERPAPLCPNHHERTDLFGVCEPCLTEAGWSGARCTICCLPLHPAVDHDGFTTHPTCDTEEEKRS